tara:strand:- start:2333 stop:2881 length:549 start_codon:yes stop_codon:yes gene_type:complete
MEFDIGGVAPFFSLSNANPTVGPSEISLDDIVMSNGAIVVFSCLHCPYVVGSVDRIESLADKARKNDIGFIAINSNAGNKNYASDSEENTRDACEKGISYPFLIDRDQSVAEKWGAERTPEFYLIDNEKKLMYKGRFDDSPKNPMLSTTSEMNDAVEQFLNGSKIEIQKTESIGCSIKWYFD